MDTVVRQQFTELYERHYGDVLRYALRRVDGELARDVAAETFTVAWRRFEQMPQDQLPWLYGVARRTLANELRSERRRNRLAGRLADAATAGTATAQPDHADEVAVAVGIWQALTQLPARDQEALRLIAWEDLNPAAAARVVGCSTTAFKVRLHRARRRLATALAATDDAQLNDDCSFLFPEVPA